MQRQTQERSRAPGTDSANTCCVATKDKIAANKHFPLTAVSPLVTREKVLTW